MPAPDAPGFRCSVTHTSPLSYVCFIESLSTIGVHDRSDVPFGVGVPVGVGVAPVVPVGAGAVGVAVGVGLAVGSGTGSVRRPDSSARYTADDRGFSPHCHTPCGQ